MAHEHEIEVLARGVLLDKGGRVLLCRNLKHFYYYLPGGHVELEESAQDALLREFKEETGLNVASRAFLAANDNIFKDHKKRRHHEINLIFRVECVKKGRTVAPPEILASLEPTIAFEWVQLSKLSKTDFKPGTVQSWLSAGKFESESAWLS